MLCINPGDSTCKSYFVSADESGKQKRRLSPSWSTPDPKQFKHKTGLLLFDVSTIFFSVKNVTNLTKQSNKFQKECTVINGVS